MTSESSKQLQAGPAGDELVETPGQCLTKARLAAGFSEEDVARELCITADKVRALENDEYGKITSDMFVRGYLRAYARSVQIDGDSLIECYDDYLQGSAGSIQAASLGLSNSDPDKPRLSANVLALVVIALAVLVWLVVAQWSGKDSSVQKDNERAAGQTAIEVPLKSLVTEDSLNRELAKAASADVVDLAIAADNSESATAETDAEQTALLVEQVPERTQVTLEAVDAQVAAEPDTATEVDVQPLSGLDQLQLTFNGECWVEVSDSKGDVLITDLQQAGDQLQLQGEAPFRLMLGNANSATVILNGERITLDIDPNRKTLRTQIGR